MAPPPEATAAPIEAFEAYCFRTGAGYERVVAAAKAMQFKPIPPDWAALLGPQQGNGAGYIVEIDAASRRMILLGASDMGACSVAADGYNVESIIDQMISNYRLRFAVENDVGLQTTSMYIPDGTSKLMSEARKRGLIAITRAKNPENRVVMLAYLPPATVSKTFAVE